MRLKLEPENLITIFLGLCFIVTGLYAYRYMGHFLNTAREASGVVVEVRYESANKKGRMHPLVRFTTADGREIVAHSDEHHNVRPGDTVRLIYDPRQPSDIEISTLPRAQKRRLLITALSVAFGLFVCLLGLRVIVLPGS
jgi:Protein of unknown function (DUF3592)